MSTIDNDILNRLYFSDILTTDIFKKICHASYSKVILVTDENVGSHYATALLDNLLSQKIKAHLITIPAGESSKTREMKAEIEDQMFELGCGRDTLMLAFGGGVVTDLTGFVASTYCRGIPVIYLPTSILAMVDAAIGGKTGINTHYGKNVLGTFSNPDAIVFDMTLLSTLPEDEYLSAFSEVIKHALICDAEYFTLLENHVDGILSRTPAVLTTIIKRSCEIKASVVAEDENEKSKREILNFGHTIAHAIELSSDYKIGHGQAVAIGLLVESYLSKDLGFLSDASFEKINNLIMKLEIPLTFDIAFSRESLMNNFKLDKKNRQAKNRFVLISSIGSVVQDENTYAHVVEPTALDRSIDYLFDLCAHSPC